MFIGTNSRHSESIEFAASAREFKAQVQAAIAAVLEPLRREGESLPQLEELQELIARLLEESGGELLATDQLYTNKLVGAAALREERDALVSHLEIHIRDGRYLLDRSVGTGVAKATLRNRRVSKVAKVAGIDAALEKNRRCADLLFGLYRMAGLDFHAERLRPKARRRKAKEPEKAEASPPSMALMRIN